MKDSFSFMCKMFSSIDVNFFRLFILVLKLQWEKCFVFNYVDSLFVWISCVKQKKILKKQTIVDSVKL